MRSHSIVLAVAVALVAACRPAYLPVSTLQQTAPSCGLHPIAPRPGDHGATYFACQVTRTAALPTDRLLAYPTVFADAAVEGEVQLQFVVDESGRVDSTSVKVLASTHDVFTRAALESLRGWDAQPAERRGRRVRQLTTHAFCFRIGPTDALARCAEARSRYPGTDMSIACAHEQVRICSVHGGCQQPAPRRPPNVRCS